MLCSQISHHNRNVLTPCWVPRTVDFDGVDCRTYLLDNILCDRSCHQLYYVILNVVTCICSISWYCFKGLNQSFVLLQCVLEQCYEQTTGLGVIQTTMISITILYGALLGCIVATDGVRPSGDELEVRVPLVLPLPYTR